MAPRSIMLSQILGRLSKKDAIIVRVVRMWVVPYRDNPNRYRLLGMVFQDKEGVRIHAIAERDVIEQFRSKIEEHGLYMMKNFNVKECDREWRPAPHAYKLYFQADTNVSENVFGRVPNFPLDIYKFKSYEEIMQTPLNQHAPYLLDFIGALIPKERAWFGKKKDSNSNYLSFTLRDIGSNEMPCTLWENYADDANSKLNKKRDVVVVVLLQMCRIGRRREDNSIYLGNSFHVTKVLIDEHIPEIEEFRRQYTAMYQPNVHKGGSSSISSASGAGVGPITKMNKLLHLKEASGYWFYGEICSVIDKQKYFYPGCIASKCNGKVYLDGEEYLCESHECKKRMAKPVQRYSVKVKVEHKDDAVIAVLLDELCSRIVGKTAVEFLRELNQKADGECEPPKELLDLEGKCFLFKVVGYSPALEDAREYYIGCLNDDPMVIADCNQEEEYSSQGSDSDDDLELLLANTTQGDSNASFDGNLKADGDTTLTPFSKRRRDEDDDSAAASSDTRKSANLKMKNIKIEKP